VDDPRAVEVDRLAELAGDRRLRRWPGTLGPRGNSRPGSPVVGRVERRGRCRRGPIWEFRGGCVVSTTPARETDTEQVAGRREAPIQERAEGGQERPPEGARVGTRRAADRASCPPGTSLTPGRWVARLERLPRMLARWVGWWCASVP
jgi:hypothetical protein